MAITVEMRTQVSELYVALFGRAPDAEGLGFWVLGLSNGSSLDDIANSMYATEPARAYFPLFLTNEEIIASFYLNVLGREADAEGLAFWTAALDAPGATEGSVINAMIASVVEWVPVDGGDPDLNAAGQLSQDLFNNKAEVAQWYAENGGDIAGATDILSTVTADDATVDAIIDGTIVVGQTFALTTEGDNIPGLIGSEGNTDTNGGDVVNGNSVTFNPGDVIDAGQGDDTLSLVLNESPTAYAGVSVSNVEQLVLRSVLSNADDADNVTLSTTGFDGAIETVSIIQSTGNTVIEDLQAGVDVIIDDVRGDVEIDFDNQNVPESINVSVNEFGESAGGVGMPTLLIDEGVEIVNLSDDAAGPAFYNSFDIEGGFSELNVTGGANGTDLYMGIMSSASELTVDLTANESDAKNIVVDMGEDQNQNLNLYTGDYSDNVLVNVGEASNDINADLGEGDNDFEIVGEADSVTIMAGSGEDDIQTDDVNFATINLGEGNNWLNMGDLSTLSLTTGDGEDYVNVGDIDSWGDISLGEGDNTLYMDNVGDVTVLAGDGNDDVSGEDYDSADINLGAGDNDLTLEDGTYLTVVTGAGEDSVDVSDTWWADINLGDGNNTLTMDEIINATIVTGSGNDSVNIDGAFPASSASLNASLGAGDDFIRLGNFGLETSGLVTDNHTIAGGDGDDTLALYGLDQADAANTFAHITSIETLQLDGAEGGSLDGLLTGANAAGVVNYDFLNGNTSGENITLTNVVNNVTVTMELDEDSDNEGQDLTLTQTPDDGANTANVHFEMIDWWSSDVYSFGDVMVDTTEVLNLSGTDDTYWHDDTLQIDNLNSLDLTTLNLSGDLEFDLWSVNAANLSRVDATDMIADVEIDLDDVAASIHVLGGSGDDEIVLNDADSAMVADGGDGDDEIVGNMNDDHLSGGAGNDTIDAGAGIDSVYGGAGDDLILWDADELFAVDVINGGDDYDTVELTGTMGTQNDSFFYQWSGVEVLDLDAGGNILTLGIIASNAGLEELYLSDDGIGGGDEIYLVEGWSNDTAIHLSNGDDAVVESLGVNVDLRVYAFAGQVTALDTLTGAGGTDTLFLTADGNTANLGGMTGFESVVVVKNGAANISITTGINVDTVLNGATLTVDATALTDTDGTAGTPYVAGDLNFDGSAELDGKFVVLGGDGDDSVNGGAGADTITTGNGADYVEGGNGADSISTGAGDDEIYGDGGNDIINAGEGNNSVEGGDGADNITAGAGADEIYGGIGNDVINAGDGMNWIEGGLGTDDMQGGSGIDTFAYVSVLDTDFGDADMITGFEAGGNGVDGKDVFNMTDLLSDTGLAGDIEFLGFFANYTLASQAVFAAVGVDATNLYLALTNEVDGTYLYGDLDADGQIGTGDLAIQLVGMTGTLDQTDFIGTIVI